MDSIARLPVPQRLAYVFGFGVMLTGLAHLLGFAILEDPQWSGPVGFRKPVVFGLSAGFTLVTMGWLLSFYQPRPRLHTLMMGAMSAALVIEIIIIDLQRFRGLPSHFNMGTPLDAALWSTMGLSILVFAIVSTLQGILSLGKLNASPELATAIRASMLLFVYSQLSGQFIVAHGMTAMFQDGIFAIENAAIATTVGENGDLKLPHALSLHSIQALPLLALLMIGSPVSHRWRIWLIRTSALGFALVVAVAQYRAFAGNPLFGSDVTENGPLALGAAAFALPFGTIATSQIIRFLRPSKNACEPALRSGSTNAS